MPTSRDPALPALAARYEIDRLIGSGGSADVYLARDVRHGRPVAMKLLRSRVGNELGADRFLREIEIAAGLQHPNILPVFDSGEADGSLYYVMPYVDGDTLRHRLTRDGPLTWEETLRIAREIGDALAYAHRRSIVHRDIKPDNILFISGHAVVADFGIARALADAGRGFNTPDGLGLGTPEYMSPEQAFGESLDARSDIYSFGSMLYEMLTGNPPFVGQAALAVLMRRASNTLPPLRARDPAVPPHVGLAIARAMAFDPSGRFASVDELLDTLAATSTATGTIMLPPRARLRSIAVLPFVNMGADGDDEYLSDGITDELIYTLAKVPELRVVARTSCFRFKGHTGDVRLIGEQLRVGAVLEGSVRRSGDTLRITAELVDVGSGFGHWTERYDRKMTDVFTVQDEIARAIVDSLKLTLLDDDAPVVTTPTLDPIAYERYLRGRFHWNQRTEAGLERSIVCLRDAIAIDPGFAQAWAALAESYVTLAIYGALAPDAAIPAARVAVLRALTAKRPVSEALSARACIAAMYDWNWGGAEDDFRRALVANPDYPTSFQWYAMNLLVPRRRFAEARQQLGRALALDPLSPVVAVSIALTHFYERDFDRAADGFEREIERDPHFGVAHLFLAQACAEQGRHAHAAGALHQAAILLGPSRELAAARGVCRARAGDRAGAQQALDELMAAATDRYVSPVLIAQVRAALGDTAGALVALAEGAERRATDLVWLGVRPVFDGLRSAPEYARIVERMQLE